MARRGRGGRTHKELAGLGWHMVEDVDTGHGNYDHILVGSAGVYFLETKNLTGIVEIRDGKAWLRRRHDPEGERRLELQRQVLGGSAKVFDEIERRCGQRVWVNGVVVLWSDFPQEVVEVDKITYVHGSKLRAWLSSQPDRLDPSAVASVAGVLAALKVEGDIAGERRTVATAKA
ncbi:MAG: nuclease-related domain-containing protein [Solirubrobacteraceae bacterium]